MDTHNIPNSFELIDKRLIKIESDTTIPFIYYERIDDKFSYAFYANINVIVEHTIGYINASYLCDQVGKNFKNWIKQEPYQEIIASLKIRNEKNLIYKYITDNIKTNGYYIHPELMFFVGSWASHKFATQIVNE